MDRITFVYEMSLFCLPFVHKMKNTTVNSVHNMNHPFCVCAWINALSAIFRTHNANAFVAKRHYSVHSVYEMRSVTLSAS